MYNYSDVIILINNRLRDEAGDESFEITPIFSALTAVKTFHLSRLFTALSL